MSRNYKPCLFCKKPVHSYQAKYCSLRCQGLYRGEQYIARWKLGLETGCIGKIKAISPLIKRYLIQSRGEKCESCGWDKQHPVTGRVPVEIDHIDGNHTNNKEQNLRILCPNCHSLTPTYRNLNRGKGRTERIAKYHTNKPL